MTTCTSAKVWYSPSAAQQPALTKPCSSMQNLLRPFRGAPVHFCSGVLRASSVFPQHGCSKTVRQMGYGRYKILCLLVRLHPPRCVVCGREWPLIQKGANGQAWTSPTASIPHTIRDRGAFELCRAARAFARVAPRLDSVRVGFRAAQLETNPPKFFCQSHKQPVLHQSHIRDLLTRR